jgi:type IV secretion system protein TrbB
VGGGLVVGLVKNMDLTEERQVDKLRRDFGPTFLQALEDSQTVEIILNADGQLWQERLGEKMRVIGRMDKGHAEAAIRTVAACLKTTITRDNPLLEGELPLDGSRFAAQLPPVVGSPIFAVRKKASSIYTLDQYVEAGIMTVVQREILCSAIRDKSRFIPYVVEVDKLGEAFRYHFAKRHP